MRIFYDGLIYAKQARGGINRYFEEFIRRLPGDFEPVVGYPAGMPPPPITHANAIFRPAPFLSDEPAGLASRFRRATHPLRPGAVAADLYHPTYYALLSGRPAAASRRPLVITVHDFILRKFPAAHDTRIDRWLDLQAAAIEAADALICVSHSTLSDLEFYHPRVARKATVIHEAAALEAPDSERGPVEGRFFLYVGSRSPYKNFAGAVAALHALGPAYRDVRLVAVGGREQQIGELAQLVRLDVEDRVLFLRDVEDPVLARLYRDSVGLVYPSLYEGFGIPVLEAMRCGTRVIAVRTSSIPEVAGAAALLVDHSDSADLAEGMRRILEEDGSEREIHLNAGRAHAATFSWKTTANRTAALYRELAR
jgi:glycosyltransferase involved in cell wall biosynthesis